MIADSFKFKGHPCFKNEWSGFDAFKPISVIIGRNNTGKSQLLDILHQLTVTEIHKIGLPYDCSGLLDEPSLRSKFQHRTSGGQLPGDHWDNHGNHLKDSTINWRRDLDRNKCQVELEFSDRVRQQGWASEYRERLAEITKVAKASVHGRKFRRLLADRDMQPEPENRQLELNADGTGGTNIIRRFINSSDAAMREELIQKDLLTALQEIFGEDARFNGIEVREDEDNKKWEVYLREPSKGLVPLSSSGSGLKTVILVLLNLLVVPEMESQDKSKFIFAFEELENNLHPALMRRLFSYLIRYVEQEKCMLVLTTHSNVALDVFGPHPDAQIIHVTHDGESASSKTIEAHFDQVGLLAELGARPSDLLQANGVIWLEGPSDRIYFNRFIELFSNGELREGRHYQCAFYGGSNLARSTFSAPDDSDETFANLLRLNHNVAVICDGDRTAASGEGSRIKKRVQRVKQEVEKFNGAFLWITEAKELENYIPGSVWSKVYDVDGVPDPEKFDRFPGRDIGSDDFTKKYLDRKSFDKCDFAARAVEHLAVDELVVRFEFKEKIESLVALIRKWNQ